MQRWFSAVLAAVLAAVPLLRAQHVEIRDGCFHVAGEKFFIKGIGYETHCRPGEAPWLYSFDPDIISFDLERIKTAGFNTIRTWGALTEEELQVVEASGLKMLFGIWIDAGEDFGDPDVFGRIMQHVLSVLDYTVDYECIIGYLIMNEPQAHSIESTGARHFAAVWRAVRDLIHERHSGIPVSFANSIVGDYIDMDMFDFTAYNAYMYNPVTVSRSHGYAGYLRFLKEHRASKTPLIVTEFGLSVSPGSSGDEYGYGGNSETQQAAGDLYMYRQLLDAGIQGGCVFQYHDGWWKAGNESSQEPLPEEWFGLISFASSSDRYGTPRPVWDAFTRYNKAIISEPRNGSIYRDTIPLEFFLTEDVASCQVTASGTTLFSTDLSTGYFNGFLEPDAPSGLRDMVLRFHFFNSGGDTVKSERISLLLAGYDVTPPSLTIDVAPGILAPGAPHSLSIRAAIDTPFTIPDQRVDYGMHPHIGFDPGTAAYRTLSFDGSAWQPLGMFTVPGNSLVTTFGAGATVAYGDFQMRVSDEIILTDGDWADPIVHSEVLTGVPVPDSTRSSAGSFRLGNYPNPFNAATTVTYTLPAEAYVTILVYDLRGRICRTLEKRRQAPGTYRRIWDGVDTENRDLPSGVYIIRLQTETMCASVKTVLLR